jgi:hypothetical protein
MRLVFKPSRLKKGYDGEVDIQHRSTMDSGTTPVDRTWWIKQYLTKINTSTRHVLLVLQPTFCSFSTTETSALHDSESTSREADKA